MHFVSSCNESTTSALLVLQSRELTSMIFVLNESTLIFIGIAGASHWLEALGVLKLIMKMRIVDIKSLGLCFWFFVG